jgi:DNA relaxase NicK
MGYRSAFQAVELPGLMVLCDPSDPDTMPRVCMVVPGDSCEALGWERLQALSVPFKPTRIDLAFDDFPFSPAEVKSLILSGSVRTRAQRHTLRWHEDYSDGLGETVTLGGRGSGQFFRCYNSRGFDRGELELKGARAEAAYELLHSPLPQAREKAISFMRGFLDFVDTSTSTNKSRQVCLLRWMVWFRWVKRVRFQLPPRPVQTLEGTWNWMGRQLAPILAVLDSRDSSRFSDVLEIARSRRWTAKHRLLLGAG